MANRLMPMRDADWDFKHSEKIEQRYKVFIGRVPMYDVARLIYLLYTALIKGVFPESKETALKGKEIPLTTKYIETAELVYKEMNKVLRALEDRRDEIAQFWPFNWQRKTCNKFLTLLGPKYLAKLFFYLFDDWLWMCMEIREIACQLIRKGLVYSVRCPYRFYRYYRYPGLWQYYTDDLTQFPHPNIDWHSFLYRQRYLHDDIYWNTFEILVLTRWKLFELWLILRLLHAYDEKYGITSISPRELRITSNLTINLRLSSGGVRTIYYQPKYSGRSGAEHVPDIVIHAGNIGKTIIDCKVREYLGMDVYRNFMGYAIDLLPERCFIATPYIRRGSGYQYSPFTYGCSDNALILTQYYGLRIIEGVSPWRTNLSHFLIQDYVENTGYRFAY